MFYIYVYIITNNKFISHVGNGGVATSTTEETVRARSRLIKAREVGIGHRHVMRKGKKTSRTISPTFSHTDEKVGGSAASSQLHLDSQGIYIYIYIYIMCLCVCSLQFLLLLFTYI